MTAEITNIFNWSTTRRQHIPKNGWSYRKIPSSEHVIFDIIKANI